MEGKGKVQGTAHGRAQDKGGKAGKGRPVSRGRGSSVDLRDMFKRTFKRIIPIYVILTIIMVNVLVIFLDMVEDPATTMLSLFNLVLVVILCIYMIWVVYKANKVVKGFRFMNMKKVQRVMRPFAVVFFVIIMALNVIFVQFLHVTTNLRIFVLTIALFCFILPMNLLSKYYTGSVTQWYDNIVVSHGRKIESELDGYTDRPYTMRMFDPKAVREWMAHISEYADLMVDNLLLAGARQFEGGLILYPPSPGFASASGGDERQLEKATRVIVHNDGNMSVFVSRDDYERIGPEKTYHELCQVLLSTFSGSIRTFLDGKRKEALEMVGGKDHVIRRKEAFKKSSFYMTRVMVVYIIVLFISVVGVIHNDRVTIDDDFTNLDENDELTTYIDVDIKAYHVPIGMRGTNPWAGDDIRITIDADDTITSIQLIGSSFPELKDHLLATADNVSDWTYRLKATNDYVIYTLKLSIEPEQDENLTLTTVHIEQTHLNAPSIHNLTIVPIVVAIYASVELLVWRRQVQMEHT
jgi:hypothetical protein